MLRMRSALTSNLAKELWWYVVLKGGVIFGVLSLLPGFILVRVFRLAMNGTWLFPYNPLTAKKISDLTDVRHLLELSLLCFTTGAMAGVCWWIIHRVQTRKAHAREQDGWVKSEKP